MSKNNSIRTLVNGGLTFTASLIGFVFLMTGSNALADVDSIDWSTAPAKTVTLFYPGQ